MDANQPAGIVETSGTRWDPEGRTVVQRRSGRPTVLELHGLEIAGILAVYNQTKSYRKAAKQLGISVNTVRKYCRGHSHPVGRRLEPEIWKTARSSTGLYKWFADHKAEKLPRSMAKLCELSGTTRGQMLWFLQRRTSAALLYLKSLGDLRELPSYLVDLEGRRIPCGMLSDYELKVDRYDLTVQIRSMLRFGGAVKFVLPFEHYRRMFRSREV